MTIELRINTDDGSFAVCRFYPSPFYKTTVTINCHLAVLDVNALVLVLGFKGSQLIYHLLCWVLEYCSTLELSRLTHYNFASELWIDTNDPSFTVRDLCSSPTDPTTDTINLHSPVLDLDNFIRICF